jgi:methionyl-tRNA formyltransferase
MRCIAFGDESTLPGMLDILRDSAVLAVVASSRPQATTLLDGHRVSRPPIAAQPQRQSPEFGGFVQRLGALQPDWFFCFSYSMILPAELLRIPPSGAINFHGGLLPAFRGAHIYNWTLIADARVTGMTAHYMTERVDEGDVIFERRVAISEEDTAASLKARVDALGFELLSEIVGMIRRNQVLPRRAQETSGARTYPRRKPEDGRIDWGMSDRQIFNMIRALAHPWPGAFFFDRQGRRITLDRYLTLEEVRRLRDTHGR